MHLYWKLSHKYLQQLAHFQSRKYNAPVAGSFWQPCQPDIIICNHINMLKSTEKYKLKIKIWQPANSTWDCSHKGKQCSHRNDCLNTKRNHHFLLIIKYSKNFFSQRQGNLFTFYIQHLKFVSVQIFQCGFSVYFWFILPILSHSYEPKTSGSRKWKERKHDQKRETVSVWKDRFLSIWDGIKFHRPKSGSLFFTNNKVIIISL